MTHNISLTCFALNIDRWDLSTYAKTKGHIGKRISNITVKVKILGDYFIDFLFYAEIPHHLQLTQLR